MTFLAINNSFPAINQLAPFAAGLVNATSQTLSSIATRALSSYSSFNITPSEYALGAVAVGTCVAGAHTARKLYAVWQSGVKQEHRTRLEEILNRWDQNHKNYPQKDKRNLKERILVTFDNDLSILNLNGLKISELPNCFHRLPNLTFIGLKDTSLTQLPDTLISHPKLKHIDTRGVQVKGRIPLATQITDRNAPQIIQTDLTAWKNNPHAKGDKEEAAKRILEAFQNNSTELILSQLDLTLLPDSLSLLTDLQKLSLTNNQLNALPNSIGALINLQELNLANNQLNTLPNSIGALINLQRLDLANNQLNALPNSIGALINLRLLLLMNNQLNALYPHRRKENFHHRS